MEQQNTNDPKRPATPPPAVLIGVDSASMPDAMPATDGEGVWRPSTSRNRAPASTGRKAWRSTAGAELEKFKPMPIVGRLPWRSQYIMFSLALAASLASLLYFAMANVKSSEMAAAMTAVQADIQEMQSGRPPTAPGLAANIQAADRAAAGLPGPAAAAWKQVKPLAQSVQEAAPIATSVVQNAGLARDRLNEGLTAAAPLWRAAGNAGEWEGVDAVNLSQVLAEMQAMAETAERIAADQGKYGERLSASRQNVEQAFRVYAASPASATQGSLNGAWRAAAAAFLKARPHLDVLIGSQRQWQSIHAADAVLAGSIKTLSSATAQGLPVSTMTGIWLSGGAVLLFLCLLILLNRLQQRWHVLQAMSGQEALELAINDISEQIAPVAAGDLTVRLQSSQQVLNPLTENINAALRGVHAMTENVKGMVDATAAAAGQATDATGVLVDVARAQAADHVASAKDILAIAAAINKVSELSSDAATSAAQILSQAEVGQNAVSDARSRIQTIRERAQEGHARSRRLKQSSSDTLTAATLLNDIAEQMSVLSIQASLQAVKAGDAGVGFRVVADGLKTLSEQSGEGARRVGSLIEANINDVEAMEAAMLVVTSETDEGSRLSDISMESSLTVAEHTRQLSELLDDIHALSRLQATDASALGQRTQQSLHRAEESNAAAQSAAEAVLSLVTTGNALNQSSLTFKV